MTAAKLEDEDVSGLSREAFLETVREFLEVALSPDLREAGRATTGVHSEIGACRTWHRRLAARGWIAPAWPRAFGGPGWSVEQRVLFDRECARCDAPILSASGIRALGPLLISIGTEAQKARYLAPILSGADLWCQGFSESGAGSDLAALSTRADPAREGYRVNGTKLWTTGAQYSNRMFALVRTAHDGKPQQGLTFLLIDMASPGISVSPIRMIDGSYEFNSVIFDDVQVPMANRVGQEGEGWSIAKLLMRYARSNNTTSAHLHRAMRRARDCGGADPSHLAEIETALSAYESLELALLVSGRLDGSDECASSLLKTQATELNQKITEFGLSIAGPLAFADVARSATRYLATRAASIYSGTSEIHRNVIGRHLIGK